MGVDDFLCKKGSEESQEALKLFGDACSLLEHNSAAIGDPKEQESKHHEENVKLHRETSAQISALAAMILARDKERDEQDKERDARWRADLASIKENLPNYQNESVPPVATGRPLKEVNLGNQKEDLEIVSCTSSLSSRPSVQMTRRNTTVALKKTKGQLEQAKKAFAVLVEQNERLTNPPVRPKWRELSEMQTFSCDEHKYRQNKARDSRLKNRR